MDISRKIYKLVQSIPPGSVTTYGVIAKAVGTSPRVVGNLLHRNPDPLHIPCHRVVNSQGYVAAAFAFGGAASQQKRLQVEGVVVEHHRVDLTRYCWQPQEGQR